ncbi:hypothetical protein [Paraburkholderia hospita]|nr:hypothetical protein [Paraburkholderia hospita]
MAHQSRNSLTAMLHLAKEKQMTTIRCCLLFLMTGSPALAGAHYVEVWNPPEAHGNFGAAQPAHKIKERQPVSVRPVQRRLHHRVAAVAPVQNASIATVERRAHEPRYQDIPRKMTPEGNVLRVDGRNAQALTKATACRMARRK